MRGMLIGVIGAAALVVAGGGGASLPRSARSSELDPSRAAVAPSPRDALEVVGARACGPGHETLGRLLARRGLRPGAPPVTLTAGYPAPPCAAPDRR